jgi:hypothetical protein
VVVMVADVSGCDASAGMGQRIGNPAACVMQKANEKT